MDKKGPWNGKVREMPNGDIALPFSAAFVMKRFENFSSSDCKVDIKMTLIIRIKFGGLNKIHKDRHRAAHDRIEMEKSNEHMLEVMSHVKEK